MGATPEVLFTRNRNHLSTMALAGTIQRSEDPTEDEALQKTLLASKKDRHEVDIVADDLATILSRFSDRVEIGPLGVLKSSRVQHLHYSLQAFLKEHVRNEDLIEALHPTPAIAGSPRKEALDFISQHEPFSRGPFATPLGFLSQDSAHLVIGIRSAMTLGNELQLFAGAGIVPDSDPVKEWQELDHKISPYLGIL